MYFDTPYSRATSPTVRPASTCFSTPIIAASLCLLVFILVCLLSELSRLEMVSDV